MKLNHFVALWALGWACGANSSVYSGVVDVTAPGNPIAGVAATVGSPTSSLATVGSIPGANNYPASAPPPSAIDNLFGAANPASKYQNFAETGAGFIVTPTAMSVITGVDFSTANDAPERDPLTITIEGTNSPNAASTLNSSWTLIYDGVTGLANDPGRNAFGSQVSFPNQQSFTSYRVLVQSVRNGGVANSFQFQEVQLLAAIPEPSSLILFGLGVCAAAGRVSAAAAGVRGRHR
jgi:hypothetical protein